MYVCTASSAIKLQNFYILTIVLLWVYCSIDLESLLAICIVLYNCYDDVYVCKHYSFMSVSCSLIFDFSTKLMYCHKLKAVCDIEKLVLVPGSENNGTDPCNSSYT